MLQNDRKQYIWSGAAFLLGAILAALIFQQNGNLLTSPLEAFGLWLRNLSLSGAGGNLLSWVIVLSISALPALGLRRGKRRLANLLLLLCSVELFAALYFLVNPTLIVPAVMASEPTIAAKAWGLTALGCIAATLLCWVLLRTLWTLDERPANLLPQLLFWAAIIYAFLLGFGAVQQTLGDMHIVVAGNTEQPRVAISSSLLFILSAVELLPSLLAVWAILLGGKLAAALDAAPFEETTIALAESISKNCMMIVKLSLLLTVAGNVLQLLLFSKVAVIHMRIDLPLLTLVLCAALILLCKYFRSAKNVSDDNATII